MACMNATKKTRVTKSSAPTLSLGTEQSKRSLPGDLSLFLLAWCTPGDLGTFARCSRACLDMVQTRLAHAGKIVYSDFRTADDAYALALLGRPPANRLREFYCELREEAEIPYIEKLVALLVRVVDRHQSTLEDFGFIYNGYHEEVAYRSLQTQEASCPALREFRLHVSDADGAIGRRLIATGYKNLKKFCVPGHMADAELMTILRGTCLEELELAIYSAAVAQCLLDQVNDRQLRRLSKLSLHQYKLRVPNDLLFRFCCRLPKLQTLDVNLDVDDDAFSVPLTYTLPLLEDFTSYNDEEGVLDHIVLHLPQVKSFAVACDHVTVNQFKQLIESSPQLTALQERFSPEQSKITHWSRDTVADSKEVVQALTKPDVWPQLRRLCLARPVVLQVLFPSFVRWEHLDKLSLFVRDYDRGLVDVTRNILLPLPRLRHLVLQHANEPESWQSGRWVRRPRFPLLTHHHLQSLSLGVGDDSVFRSWSFPELSYLQLGPHGDFETLGVRMPFEATPFFPKLRTLSLRKLAYVDVWKVTSFARTHTQRALTSLCLEDCDFDRFVDDHFLLHLATGELSRLQNMTYKQYNVSIDALADFIHVARNLRSLTLEHDAFTSDEKMEIEKRAAVASERLQIKFEE